MFRPMYSGISYYPNYLGNIQLVQIIRGLSNLRQNSTQTALKSEIFLSAELCLKMGFTKGISAEYKISDLSAV